MLSGSGGATFALCEHEDAARALGGAITLPVGAKLFVAPLAEAAGWRAPSAA
jgi:4-diphosphocytidyl-2C-methyl-D-erythritol kinase